MIKLPKIEAHMDRSRSAVFCLALSAMIAAAPAYECAWAKDGNSGSGNGGGGNSGKGNSGEGSGAGSAAAENTTSSLRNLNSETVGRRHALRSWTLENRRPTKRRRMLDMERRAASTSELQADFRNAQLALKEAKLNFNRALADPKADLRTLEQAIRNAELALTTAGAKLAVASAGK